MARIHLCHFSFSRRNQLVTIRNGEESVFSLTALLRSGFISVICVDIPLGSRQNARMNSVFLQPR